MVFRKPITNMWMSAAKVTQVIRSTEGPANLYVIHHAKMAFVSHQALASVTMDTKCLIRHVSWTKIVSRYVPRAVLMENVSAQSGASVT